MITWKKIPQFDGYEASSNGLVRSVDRVVMKLNKWGSIGPVRYKGRQLKPWRTKDGYLQVELNDGKKQCVHRLVAMAFVDGQDDGLTVNHKDGDKSNNTPDNLEWITAVENTNHALYVSGFSSIKPVPVILRNESCEYSFRSLSDAARFLGVGVNSVSSAEARNGKCRGFFVTRQKGEKT